MNNLQHILNKNGINMNNVVSFYFGCDCEQISDIIIISPIFSSEIFEKISTKIVKISLHRDVYNIRIKNFGYITFLRIGMCAPIIGDIVSCIGMLKNKKVIFLGTAGTLIDINNIGDIVVPVSSIDNCFYNYYNKSNIGERHLADTDLYRLVMTLSNDFNLKKDSSILSTNSLLWEKYYYDEIMKFSADIIDMETSTLYKMSSLFKIPTISILVISDSVYNNKLLFGGITTFEKRKFLMSVSETLPQLIAKLLTLLENQ